MPFDDEISPAGVTVHAYRPEWVAEAAGLAEALAEAVPRAVAIEHIGSTSIPGMAAKDCLDMMIVVRDFEDSEVERNLVRLGYRRRPEPWNNLEPAEGREWPKMVFAPPVGGRSRNLHVRLEGSGTARVALLFRDHLRAHPTRTGWWSELKIAAASGAADLAAYGRVKYPAWCLLMELAESWARETGWRPPRYGR